MSSFHHPAIDAMSAYPAADRIDDEDVESDGEVNVPLAVAL